MIQALGLVMAGGVLFLVAVAAPDGGPDPISVRQGVAYGAVFASVAVAMRVGRDEAGHLVSLGGAAIVAGMVTMPGGNPLGAAMAGLGLLVFGTGALRRPPLNTRVIGRLVGVGILLILGLLFAAGHGFGSWLVALAATSAVVVVSRIGTGRA
jgi:hypothetical protein